ncbi:transcription-repair coupling factor (superfamily II helicase) [Siphonobacter sp. SORGH_AS 1065]|nr:transcription-repair coupling factor (superfamily II helicase) [Siphonobacter sp. SORGH_AS_1065]
MLVKDLLTLYRNDPFIRLISERIQSKQPNDYHLQIKGLAGSLDSVLVASLYQHQPASSLLVLSDKEEAAYFYNDLQNLLGEDHVLFFSNVL